MDVLLKKIKDVERKSITDIEMARSDRDESIRIARTDAQQHYDTKVKAHQARLMTEQEKKVECFREQAKQVVENGKLDAQKAKQIPQQDIDRAQKAVYELVIRG